MFHPMETQDFLMSIGKIIRARRKALKLSQERLAELANLHPTYISEIERGKVNASVYCFYTIAQALDLEFADFLFLSDDISDRSADQELSSLFDQFRRLEPAKRELVLGALQGMLAGLT